MILFIQMFNFMYWQNSFSSIRIVTKKNSFWKLSTGLNSWLSNIHWITAMLDPHKIIPYNINSIYITSKDWARVPLNLCSDLIIQIRTCNKRTKSGVDACHSYCECAMNRKIDNDFDVLSNSSWKNYNK